MNIQNLNRKNYEINNYLDILRKKGSELSDDHIEQYIKHSFSTLSVVEKMLFDKQKQRERNKKDFEYIRTRVRTHKKYKGFIENNNLHIDGRDILYITNDLKRVFSIDGVFILELSDYSDNDNKGNIYIPSEILFNSKNEPKVILVEGIKKEFQLIKAKKIIQLDETFPKFKGIFNNITFDMEDEFFERLQINCINSWGLPILKESTNDN